MIKIKATYEENSELLGVIEELRQAGNIKKIKYAKDKGRGYRTAYITLEIDHSKEDSQIESKSDI